MPTNLKTDEKLLKRLRDSAGKPMSADELHAQRVDYTRLLRFAHADRLDQILIQTQRASDRARDLGPHAGRGARSSRLLGRGRYSGWQWLRTWAWAGA